MITVTKRYLLGSLSTVILVVLTGLLIYFFSSPTSIHIDKRPLSIIRRAESGLNRPEGIAFSPSNTFIAVANSHSNSVSFYKKLLGDSYAKVPYFTLKNPEAQLNCPHDLSFSPDGSLLAIANTHAKTVTFYRKNPHNSCYSSSPIAIIQGDLAHIEQPYAIKFSPTENVLAIADVAKHRISFFRYGNGLVDPLPYQIIQNSIDILNRPDGLAFTSDGELLAVTSHGNHAVVLYQQIPNSMSIYSPDPVEILQGDPTHFCFTNSVSFHPSNNYLAVSSGGSTKSVRIFKKTSESFPRYSIIPEQSLEIYSSKTLQLRNRFPEEAGVKGVTFSPDGKQMGVCASDLANPHEKILIFHVRALKDNLNQETHHR